MNINDRCMGRAAVVKAAGHPVAIHKVCSPRCFASYPDTPEIAALIKAYDAREVLPIPQKKIMVAYGEIMAQVRDLKQGVL